MQKLNVCIGQLPIAFSMIAILHVDLAERVGQVFRSGVTCQWLVLIRTAEKVRYYRTWLSHLIYNSSDYS